MTDSHALHILHPDSPINLTISIWPCKDQHLRVQSLVRVELKVKGVDFVIEVYGGGDRWIAHPERCVVVAKCFHARFGANGESHWCRARGIKGMEVITIFLDNTVGVYSNNSWTGESVSPDLEPELSWKFCEDSESLDCWR
jgi:hypothetical protein